MFLHFFVSHRNITFKSFCFYKCFCLDDTPICNSQNEPLLVSRRHILYRHPIFVLLDGGRTRGKSCTWTRWACVSRLPIIQWSVSRWRLFGAIFQCYKPIDSFLIELSIIDYKNKESCSDEKINHWKSLLLAPNFCNSRWFVMSIITNLLLLALSG